MALGGGTWQFQNKKLPGTYINFVSRVRPATDFADRGFGTMPLELEWGPDNAVFRVDAADFQKYSLKLFGYDHASDKMRGLRDLFRNLKTGYFYRLSNGAKKAECAIARAKYAGVRGNDLTVAVSANVDEPAKFDVITYLIVDGARTVVDKQTAAVSWDDVKDNDFVSFIRTVGIAVVAGINLTGGSNGEAITGVQYQAYLDAIEPYYYNCMGYAGTDNKIKDLFIQFNKRLRDQIGAKFQLVIYDKEGVDYEGVITVKNSVLDVGVSPGSLVYWTLGAEASCLINASCTNKVYDGDYTVNTKYGQTELERAVVSGMLIFHGVTDAVAGDVKGEVKILEDVNSFTSFTKQKNDDFSMNQVIRVLDQMAIDISRMFNKMYSGKEPNDPDGRVALWGDVVALNKEYQRIRAIQNFKPEDVPIPSQGEKKNAVLSEYAVQPTCCMEKLYMTIMVA